MYENLKSRIAALEEDQVHGEEEQKKIGTVHVLLDYWTLKALHLPSADDARKSIKGASESVIQTKYLELVMHIASPFLIDVSHVKPAPLRSYLLIVVPRNETY
jgi:hypothetical protein